MFYDICTNPMILQILVSLIPVEMGEHALHRTQPTIHVVVLLVSLECCVKQTLQTVNQPLVIMVGHVWRNMVQQLTVFVLKVLLELSAQHAFLVSFLLQFNASETVLSCDEQRIPSYCMYKYTATHCWHLTDV